MPTAVIHVRQHIAEGRPATDVYMPSSRVPSLPILNGFFQMRQPERKDNRLGVGSLADLVFY